MGLQKLILMFRELSKSNFAFYFRTLKVIRDSETLIEARKIRSGLKKILIREAKSRGIGEEIFPLSLTWELFLLLVVDTLEPLSITFREREDEYEKNRKIKYIKIQEKKIDAKENWKVTLKMERFHNYLTQNLMQEAEKERKSRDLYINQFNH